MAETGLSSGTRTACERHAVKEGFERLRLLAPFDDGRRVRPADDEILRRGQGGNQREVLVHHAEAERLSVARIADGDLGAVKQELPRSAP
jgi:hypothetical protein